MDVAVRVRITGRVQRVGFRYWTIAEANRRGLAGWVRNCRDGSVEALLVGAAEAVDAMIAACRNGPPAAAVTALATEPVLPVPPVSGFTSLPTA